jgi:hypothetical protein
MRMVRVLRHVAVSVGLGLGPLCLWVVALGPVVVTSGCGDESKTTGTTVKEDPVVREQMESEREATEAYIKERRGGAKKGGR